jgi:RNA polymerase sigma factor (sigma-70 family)
MHQSELLGIDRLARRLPFALDAVDEAGAAFARWRLLGRERDRRTVDLWTYCYIRRYFLVRFAREPSFGVSELEDVVEKAFRRVEEGRATLREPERYARWTTVVCRRTYLNFVSRRRELMPVDRIAEPEADGPSAETLHDRAGTMRVLVAAVERLPAFLRPYARLRFVDGLEYEEIADRTGRPVPTVRAYAHKAILRFRADGRLMRHVRERAGYESGEGGS